MSTPAIATGARSIIMGRKGRKDTPRDADTAGDDAVETINVRAQMIKDMQQEIKLEQYNVKRRAEVEGEEQGNREAQLQETRGILSLHWAAYARNARSLEETENWARYMTCDGLPDPGSLPDMNTFLSLWTIEHEEASVVAMPEKCRMITSLLTKLEGIVRFSTSISAGYVGECELIARQLRYKLQRWIDDACYRLLRDIETNMTRMDPKTATYVSTANEAVCCVWAPIPLPIAAKRQTERERKPIEVEFDELELSIKMPVDVDCYRMAIRGLWLAYDHYSVETASCRMPDLPNHLILPRDPSIDLLHFSRKEFEEKLRIWRDQAEERLLRVEEKKAILERIENPPALAGNIDRRGRRRKIPKRPQTATAGKQQQLLSILPTDTQLLPFLPTADEIIQQREDETRKEVRRLLFTRCEKTEVNLRKYRILGGVFHVDLVYQPPQPKDLGGETWLTTLELPKETRFVPFARPYEPPQPAADSERTPEVIEAEMKALEAAMEALALITLKLPDTVYWFEPPLVAHWIPGKNIWSTKDVHDVKYNEEKQTIAFRSGRLGVHGLAAYKFANLPFQSWELKPETGRSGRDYGGVVLSVTAATVQAEFIVRGDRVCLNSLVGGASKPLKHILGDYTDLETLIERMQQVGCDLFPEPDAVSYLKGLAIKHPIAAKQLRECMALLSTAYTFAWSRWNATRDYREIVLQLKEVHGCVAKEGTNLTLLVTPSQTMRIRCTEISPEFSHLPLDENDAKFYADLYQLAMDTAGIKTRLLIKQIPFTVMSTVARLLDRTNVIEMSS